MTDDNPEPAMATLPDAPAPLWDSDFTEKAQAALTKAHEDALEAIESMHDAGLQALGSRAADERAEEMASDA